MCTVNCALSAVHCQLCTVSCALSTVHCKKCTVNCAVSNVHCQLYTVSCALSIVHCQLYTVHCTLSNCTVNCKLSTVHCQLRKDRLRHTVTRSAAACVVAQQYSSATFEHWAFIGANEIWALFTPVTIDMSLCLSTTALVCDRLYWYSVVLLQMSEVSQFYADRLSKSSVHEVLEHENKITKLS